MVWILSVSYTHLDVYKRQGGSADKILDLLYDYHSLDIEWGNHDILWMGAACGNDACICSVIRNNLKYDNVEILENAYGISLRQLILFGMKTYGIEAVSYTHLDVYKRQVHFSLTGLRAWEESTRTMGWLSSCLRWLKFRWHLFFTGFVDEFPLIN